MINQEILVEREDGIATVILNRPEVKNALSMEMIKGLKEIIDGFGEDDSVKAVIITGAGNDFCSGADLACVQRDTSFVRIGCPSAQDVVTGIMGLEKPVIAAVSGFATAGGCELAIACDIRIASEGARFGELFIKIGLIPGMVGIYLLPRLIGPGRAKEFVFTGDIIDAVEAEKIGLVNRVVPNDRLLDEAKALAKRLAAGPLLAIGKAKTAINRSLDADLRGSLDHMAAVQAKLCETEDHREGVSAFLEKRKATFRGR
ncbi:MAG: enoyl-CoA hydratase [Syntrophales bacterium]|nr:enoyl-CoA hydratase [Syntrophales bacterium]